MQAVTLSVPLTGPGQDAKIAQMADYFVIPTPVPCSVALFTCPCGAHAVEYDVKRAAPTGWSTADDGSCRCPRCSAKLAGRTPLTLA
jgi:hypothetical protein